MTPCMATTYLRSKQVRCQVGGEHADNRHHYWTNGGDVSWGDVAEERRNAEANARIDASPDPARVDRLIDQGYSLEEALAEVLMDTPHRHPAVAQAREHAGR